MSAAQQKPVRPGVRIAFCGMAVGLSVVIMLMGGLIPAAVYAVPLLCGLVLLPISIEFGRTTAWATFAATALLAMMLDFDKEAAFFYLFIGYYPIVKWSLDKLSPPALRLIAKLALFTVSVVAMYALMNLLFPMEAFMREFREMGTLLLLGLLVVYDVSMLLYDRLMMAALMIYANRIRPQLRFLKR